MSELPGDPGTGAAGAGDLPAESGAPGERAELIEGVAAALRADSADLDAYHHVLSTTIGDLLPAGMVEVDHERSFGDRMAGRQGRATAIRLRLGDAQLELTSHHGAIVAIVATQVRGVTISKREVPIDEWARQLATYLAEAAARSASAREALGKLVGE